MIRPAAPSGSSLGPFMLISVLENTEGAVNVVGQTHGSVRVDVSGSGPALKRLVRADTRFLVHFRAGASQSWTWSVTLPVICV